MGKIKPTYIKRVAVALLDKFPDHFNKDFDHNKAMVANLTDVQTEAMRNKIAGYVTRFKAKETD